MLELLAGLGKRYQNGLTGVWPFGEQHGYLCDVLAGQVSGTPACHSAVECQDQLSKFLSGIGYGEDVSITHNSVLEAHDVSARM